MCVTPNVVPCCAQDDPKWHNADSDRYESEGEGERYEFGQECLDRMALALGGSTVVPLASRYLPALLADRDWRQRHAALICLSQIAEGCVKIMHNNHSGLVDMCLQVSKFCSTHGAAPVKHAVGWQGGLQSYWSSVCMPSMPGRRHGAASC